MCRGLRISLRSAPQPENTHRQNALHPNNAPGKKRPAVSHSRTDCDFQEYRKILQVIPGKLPLLPFAIQLDLTPGGQPRRASHQDAIQIGRLSTTAATAIATGPNSPAPNDTNVVMAPNPMPAITEPFRRPCRQRRRQPSANGKPHTATGKSDTVRSRTLDSRIPKSGGGTDPGRNRTAACPAMQAGSHRSASAQKLRLFTMLRVFIPTACIGCAANSSEEPKGTYLGAAIVQQSSPDDIDANGILSNF